MGVYFSNASLIGFIWYSCRPSWHLALVVLVISLGLGLMVKGETQFNAMGFVLVMTASTLSGLRWTITQVLLQGDGSEGHGIQPGWCFQRYQTYWLRFAYFEEESKVWPASSIALTCGNKMHFSGVLVRYLCRSYILCRRGDGWTCGGDAPHNARYPLFLPCWACRLLIQVCWDYLAHSSDTYLTG